MSKSDSRSERFEEYSDLGLPQVDEAHLVSGVHGPPLHVENELDAFGREQEPLWEAEGLLQSRAATVLGAAASPAERAVAKVLDLHNELVNNAQHRVASTYEVLSPFVRRKSGQRTWYLLRTALLLGGDVVGQAGAQIYYGEVPELALLQSLASGTAVVTAGLVGGEVKDLRMTAKRKVGDEELSTEQARFAHFFDGTDRGRKTVSALVCASIATGALLATGIFSLRASIDGPLSGLTYGAFAGGVAIASFVSSYMYADEAADAIDSAEKVYEKTVRRHFGLAAHPSLKQAASTAASVKSIRAEFRARGTAATVAHEGLKHRVLRRNPGVAGHSPTPGPSPVIGTRARPKASK